MQNRKFTRLLSEAHLQLDELSKLVRDTVRAEKVMIDKALNPCHGNEVIKKAYVPRPGNITLPRN